MIVRTAALVVLMVMLACLARINAQQTYGKQLRWVTQWKSLDFVFSSPREREEALASRRFIPENCIPLDMDVDYHSSKILDRLIPG